MNKQTSGILSINYKKYTPKIFQKKTIQIAKIFRIYVIS